MPDQDERLLFGVGCLFFTAGRNCKTSWQEAITESLTSIENVTDIEIGLYGFEDDDAIASPGFIPAAVTLRFGLHVPLDEQRGLDRFLQRIPCTAEHFTVLMITRYYGSVTFVVPHGSTFLEDSSSSVIVVREYLRKEFVAREVPIELNIVGPTPFHANSYLELADIGQPFALVRVPTRGYGELAFHYSADHFDSRESATKDLFDSLSEELSFYYSLAIQRSRRLKDSVEISEMTQELLDIYQAKGFQARIRRVFTSSTKIRQVALKAVSAQYQIQDDDWSSRHAMESLYASDVAPFLKDDIEAELAGNYANEALGAKEVVTLLDQARQRQIEVTSLFLSAVAGGVAGALISLLIH